MAVVGPGLNRYYKKIDLKTDVNLSSLYKDLFDGQSTTSKITGGADSQMYMSDLTIPDESTYGNSKLVGLKQYLFPTDIDVVKNNFLQI